MKKRQCAETQKPRIIQSFYETILAEGFEHASIAKVAKRLDIHSTLILHYFGNKENMTLALVDFVVQEYAALFQKIRKKQKRLNPDQKMQSFFQSIWSKPYYEKIDIAASLSVISVSFRNPRVQKKIKWLYERFQSVLVQELEDWVAHGIIPDQDVKRTAGIIMSMVEGSRHFRHFFIRNKDIVQYNQDMAMVATRVARDRSWQEG